MSWEAEGSRWVSIIASWGSVTGSGLFFAPVNSENGFCLGRTAQPALNDDLIGTSSRHRVGEGPSKERARRWRK